MESFIDTQKYSVMKNMKKTFARYPVPRGQAEPLPVFYKYEKMRNKVNTVIDSFQPFFHLTVWKIDGIIKEEN